MNSLFTGVCNCYNNQRLDQIFADQALRGFVYTPLHARKGRCGVENVLAILQIQNRVAFSRKTRISLRQPDQHVPSISKNLGRKLSMPANAAGERVVGHGKRDASLKISTLSTARPH